MRASRRIRTPSPSVRRSVKQCRYPWAEPGPAVSPRLGIAVHGPRGTPSDTPGVSRLRERRGCTRRKRCPWEPASPRHVDIRFCTSVLEPDVAAWVCSLPASPGRSVSMSAGSKGALVASEPGSWAAVPVAEGGDLAWSGSAGKSVLCYPGTSGVPGIL